jgi:hypothetical protein
VHAAYQAIDALKVAGTAALEFKTLDDTGGIVHFYHKDLGAHTLRIENILHGYPPFGNEGDLKIRQGAGLGKQEAHAPGLDISRVPFNNYS